MNALIRSIALAVAFGTAGAAASAKTARSAPESAKIAQSASESKQTAQSGANRHGTMAAPAAAPAPSRDQQSLSGQRSGRSADEEAIQQQLRFRVLMPPLSGDGGG